MFVTSLTDAERATLIAALKYWRRHRGEGARRTDQVLPPPEVDILAMKLAAGMLASPPPEEVIAGPSSH